MYKKCFKCEQIKPISEFYSHPETADKHLNKCKSCTKNDVTNNYASKREYYSLYEKVRNSEISRKSSRLIYQKTRRERYPEKYKARNAVSNALRDGRLVRMPCEVCGDTKSQAHHDDYKKPLQVRWLCFKHHRETEHGQVVIFSN